MQELIIKVKKLHEDAIMPLKKDDEDAGWDLYAIEDTKIRNCSIAKIHTGIALGIPKGYRVHIRPRSSLGFSGLSVMGGVIDRGYTGELIICLCNNIKQGDFIVKKGDRIAQFVLEEDPQFVSLLEVDELEETKRGNKGFGSSGK